ncbi:hypothetical protein Bca101_009529 [Brassica carinata]
MPSVAVKLYNVFFKLLLKHCLQNLISASPDTSPDPFSVSIRPDESVAAANLSFADGVATKDIHVDPMMSFTPRSDRRHSQVIPLNQTSPERSESRRRSYRCSKESYGGYTPSPRRSSEKERKKERKKWA